MYKRQGHYNGGCEDLGYRELYTRWLEYGVFLPIFRSHGTDTPREIWNFGEPGSPFYDAIEKFIRLRYRLLPYIYSLAASVTFRQDTVLRSLLFDFSEDTAARQVSDEFMFGRSLLVLSLIHIYIRLVKNLERVDRGYGNHEKQSRRKHGKSNMEECLNFVSSVNLGRFIVSIRYSL